jgi:hypothetical protein
VEFFRLGVSKAETGVLYRETAICALGALRHVREIAAMAQREHTESAIVPGLVHEIDAFLAAYLLHDAYGRYGSGAGKSSNGSSSPVFVAIS